MSKFATLTRRLVSIRMGHYETPNFTRFGAQSRAYIQQKPENQAFLRRERVMNLLSYILEIQFIIKMSMP